MRKGNFCDGIELFKYAWSTKGTICMDVHSVNGFIVQTLDEAANMDTIDRLRSEEFIKFGFKITMNYVYADYFSDEKEFYRCLYDVLIIEAYYVYKDIEPRRSFFKCTNVIGFDWRDRMHDRTRRLAYKRMISDEAFNELVNCIMEICKYIDIEPDEWLLDYAEKNIKKDN